MVTYVIFNGDEGLIAAYIIIKAIGRNYSNFPNSGKIKTISGVKTDLGLWRFLPEDLESSVIYSLDLALTKNIKYVEKILSKGNLIVYIDHHNPGNNIPTNKNFKFFLPKSSGYNTSTQSNELAGNNFDLWAMVGAAGDNKKKIFNEISIRNNLDKIQKKILWRFGKFINSHSFKPKQGLGSVDILNDILYYNDPFEFINKSNKYGELAREYIYDFKYVRSLRKMIYKDKEVVIVEFPIGPESQRMFATFAYIIQRHNKNKVVFCLF